MWQPTTTIEALKARAKLYQLIRTFFQARDVLEVETPLLCSETVTDPHIQSFTLANPVNAAGNVAQYLQSSPEFCMKRLLADGSGDIYQIAKAFRAAEFGRKHNPEFTMLEWYRIGQSFDDLIADVVELIKLAADAFALRIDGVRSVTYAQLFEQVLAFNPHTASLDVLQKAAALHYPQAMQENDRMLLLDVLMTHVIEPAMDEHTLYVVTDFPAQQAALAKVQHYKSDSSNTDGSNNRDATIAVARRFEVYFSGVELANGYDELRDAQELKARFAQDAAYRKVNQLLDVHCGEKLLAAMTHGLPECVGVAMGLDRLLMLLMGADSLNHVLSFAADNA